MKLHILAGVPRAGSTATAAVLKQNPRFYVSPTSHVGRGVMALANIAGNAPEVRAAFGRDKALTDAKIIRSYQAQIQAWYGHLAGQYDVVFDKCRDWNGLAKILRMAFPESRLILPVRDLRNCVASAVKGDVTSGHVMPDAPLAGTVFSQTKTWLEPTSLFGGPITFVEDLKRRSWDEALFWEYEYWTRNPERAFRKLYDFIGEPYFEHDYSDITMENIDHDYLYGYKFRHDVAGPVRPSNPDSWRECFDEDLARNILNAYPYYAGEFNHR